jgi:hypothetical protein
MGAGAFLLAFFVAFVLLVYWVRKNDALAPDQPTIGLFRMSFYDKDAKAQKPDPSTGAPQTANRPAARAARSDQP